MEMKIPGLLKMMETEKLDETVLINIFSESVVKLKKNTFFQNFEKYSKFKA